MGLFDVKGFTDIHPQVGLGNPLFDKIKIKGNKTYYSGKDFEIEVKDNSPINIYVQSYTLNGKVLNEPFIQLKDIQQGGKLIVQMGPNPKDNY